MKKTNYIIGAFLIFILFNLTSCAPEGGTYKEYGFFSGILHGFVMIFAVIGKMFGSDVGLYARNNTGFFYWLGFLIGLGVIGGGGSSAASRR